MGCLTLPPMPECGFGTCVNNSCVCQAGVVQNVEGLYLKLAPEIIGVCDFYTVPALVTTSVLLALTLTTFANQFSVVENRRQAFRLIPLLIGYWILIGALVIRIVNMGDPLWGINPAYTFCIALVILCLSFAFLIFLNKYLAYLNSLLTLKGSYRKFAKLSTPISVMVAILLTTATGLWVSQPFVDSVEVAGQLMIAGCSIYTTCFIYLTISSAILLSKYLSDLYTLTRNSKELGVERSAFVAKCQAQIPKVRRARFATIVASLSVVVVTFFAIVLPGWMKQWNFVVYSSLALYELANLAVVRANSKKVTPTRAVRNYSFSCLMGCLSKARSSIDEPQSRAVTESKSTTNGRDSKLDSDSLDTQL